MTSFWVKSDTRTESAIWLGNYAATDPSAACRSGSGSRRPLLTLVCGTELEEMLQTVLVMEQLICGLSLWQLETCFMGPAREPADQRLEHLMRSASPPDTPKVEPEGRSLESATTDLSPTITLPCCYLFQFPSSNSNSVFDLCSLPAAGSPWRRRLSHGQGPYRRSRAFGRR